MLVFFVYFNIITIFTKSRSNTVIKTTEKPPGVCKQNEVIRFSHYRDDGNRWETRNGRVLVKLPLQSQCRGLF